MVQATLFYMMHLVLFFFCFPPPLSFPPVVQQLKSGHTTSFLSFLDHTQLDTHTLRTILNERLACRKDRYLHNTHEIRAIPSARFELAIPEVKQLQTYFLDRMTTGMGFLLLGAFAKFLQVTTSFVVFVRPSVPMEQLGSQWTDFDRILYFTIFRKHV
jgi:hypothetical protein